MRQNSGLSFKYFSLWLPIIFCIYVCCASCGTSKKVKYFKNIPDSISTATPMVIDHAKFIEPTIQPSDVLVVQIQTIDPRSVDMISGSSAVNGVGGGNNGGTGANSSSPGYFVDKDGYIVLPLVGRIKVGGLTTTEARNVIHDTAVRFYKEPVVNVRFGNFTINMLGEFTRPGRYTVTDEKVSILDAIGIAGDLTLGGKRENVLLLREDNGHKLAYRFNLNSTDFFASNEFYLKPGDVLYVQPNKAKSRGATVDATTDRYISYFVSLVTIIIAVSTVRF